LWLAVGVLFSVESRKADPLDLDQWVFFVLPTRVLDEKLGDQKTVGLSELELLLRHRERSRGDRAR